MEVGDGLGQLGGVEAGQEVLELAERGAGLAEHVGVGDEVVGDGAFDELVYPPGAVHLLVFDVARAVLGGDDVERLLVLGAQVGGDEFDVAHQVHGVREDVRVHLLQDVPVLIRVDQEGDVDVAVTVCGDALDVAVDGELIDDGRQFRINVSHVEPSFPCCAAGCRRSSPPQRPPI